MNNFTFQNPTKLVFGKGSIAQLPKEISKKAKVMLTFGGGSVKNNGVYDQVITALAGYNLVEFWGIEPNPKVETLRKAVELGKAEKVDFILAVGGGSTLDGTKLIAAAIPYAGDAWELVLNPKLIKTAVPFASVMTLPATGSEMNSGAVISNVATKEKFAFHAHFPQFAVLDPEVTYSLPPYQIACGIADTFVHVMEQYLTSPGQSLLMDRWAEGILKTLTEIAPEIDENPQDYDLMSTYMLCATMALNGFIAMGVPQDWATHMIGHELTALYGIDHARTLAIIGPNLYKVMFETKKAKLAQYGQRIFNLTGSEDEIATEAINKTVAFFHTMGMQTQLSDYTKDFEKTADFIAKRFEERGWKGLGEKQNITPEKVREIVTASY